MTFDFATASIQELEARQTELLQLIRHHVSSDDCDSAELLDLATELRRNDDRIDELLLDNRG